MQNSEYNNKYNVIIHSTQKDVYVYTIVARTGQLNATWCLWRAGVEIALSKSASMRVFALQCYWRKQKCNNSNNITNNIALSYKYSNSYI